MAIRNRVHLNPSAKPVRFPIAAAVMVSALLVGCGLVTCDQTAARSASAPGGGVSTVRILAEAGSLDVEGQVGLTEVRAEGTACASNASDLGQIQFEVTASGSEVVIEARTPNSNDRFDVTVTVPDSVLVEIEDGSGRIGVRDVAGLRLTDGSGEVAVTGVSGDLTVAGDGSGDIDLRSIGGKVEIEADGSGGITVTNVASHVRIGSDGSGSITITAVAGDVSIGSDGSGSITVTDVGGDFVVGQGGSGSIDYSGVGGTVDIPAD